MDNLISTTTTAGRGRRIAFLLCFSAAIVASLLTFPNGVPWIVAGWLGIAWIQQLRSRSTLWPLLAGAAVLIAKGTNPSPAFTFLLLAVILLTGDERFRKADPARYARSRWFLSGLGLVGIALSWQMFASEWWSVSCAQWFSQPREDAPVVCLGDSLTFYEERTGGYPEVLRTLIDRPVINLGQPGITTAEALPKVAEMQQHRPGFVVIELGGHDFLKGLPRAEAKANLIKMIAEARLVRAEVILIEIPRGFIHDPWWGLDREIARETGVRLVPDGVIRSFVLYSPFAPPGMWTGGPYLSDDGLHPNANGNAVLAKAVAAAIVRP